MVDIHMFPIYFSKFLGPHVAMPHIPTRQRSLSFHKNIAGVMVKGGQFVSVCVCILIFWGISAKLKNPT